MAPAFSRSTALGRPSFTLNTTLHARPAARSTAAVPRAPVHGVGAAFIHLEHDLARQARRAQHRSRAAGGHKLEPQRRELARHRHGFRLVVLIYADEYGAFLR